MIPFEASCGESAIVGEEGLIPQVEPECKLLDDMSLCRALAHYEPTQQRGDKWYYFSSSLENMLVSLGPNSSTEDLGQSLPTSPLVIDRLP